MRTRISGDWWKFEVLPNEEYEDIYGEDSDGITVYEKKTVHIRRDSFNEETVVHELIHVKFHYLCLTSADISTQQLEEVACEFFATQGKQTLQFGKRIYNKLRKGLNA